MKNIRNIAIGLILGAVFFENWLTNKQLVYTNKEILSRLDECIYRD
jgi:hypothetical protein